MSDIHGCYQPMLSVLGYANYVPGVDTLVVGGDMIDRGPDSAYVIREIRWLQQNHPNVHVLSGNHEDMFKNFYNGKDDMWLAHGVEAIDSFQQAFTEEEFGELAEWLTTLPSTFEDERHLFVHAGINPNRRVQLREEMLWMPYDSHDQKRFSSYSVKDILHWTDGRKVVHGHTPKHRVIDDGARICCDLGAGVLPGGKLALVDLTNDEVYFYDFVTDKVGSYMLERKQGQKGRRRINEGPVYH